MHPPDKCRICNRWLKDKGLPALPSVHINEAANISDENQAYDDNNSQSSNDNSTSLSSMPTQDVQALLVSTMNLVSANDVVKDLICDALNAFNDLW